LSENSFNSGATFAALSGTTLAGSRSFLFKTEATDVDLLGDLTAATPLNLAGVSDVGTSVSGRDFSSHGDVVLTDDKCTRLPNK